MLAHAQTPAAGPPPPPLAPPAAAAAAAPAAATTIPIGDDAALPSRPHALTPPSLPRPPSAGSGVAVRASTSRLSARVSAWLGDAAFTDSFEDDDDDDVEDGDGNGHGDNGGGDLARNQHPHHHHHRRTDHHPGKVQRGRVVANKDLPRGRVPTPAFPAPSAPPPAAPIHHRNRLILDRLAPRQRHDADALPVSSNSTSAPQGNRANGWSADASRAVGDEEVLPSLPPSPRGRRWITGGPVGRWSAEMRPSTGSEETHPSQSILSRSFDSSDLSSHAKQALSTGSGNFAGDQQPPAPADAYLPSPKPQASIALQRAFHPRSSSLSSSVSSSPSTLAPVEGEFSGGSRSPPKADIRVAAKQTDTRLGALLLRRMASVRRKPSNSDAPTSPTSPNAAQPAAPLPSKAKEKPCNVSARWSNVRAWISRIGSRAPHMMPKQTAASTTKDPTTSPPTSPSRPVQLSLPVFTDVLSTSPPQSLRDAVPPEPGLPQESKPLPALPATLSRRRVVDKTLPRVPQGPTAVTDNAPHMTDSGTAPAAVPAVGAREAEDPEEDPFATLVYGRTHARRLGSDRWASESTLEPAAPLVAAVLPPPSRSPPRTLTGAPPSPTLESDKPPPNATGDEFNAAACWRHSIPLVLDLTAADAAAAAKAAEADAVDDEGARKKSNSLIVSGREKKGWRVVPLGWARVALFGRR